MTLYLAFVLAAAVVLVIPGPTVMLVVGQALAEGRRSALPLVLGVALGDATALGCSLAGLGALLATSATLFGIFKLLGAAYLVWLGVRLWREAGRPMTVQPAVRAGESARGRSFHALLGHAWVVTALNPKAMAFFVAFLPQFVDHGRPLAGQLTVLGVTFVVMAAANAAGYALLASSARNLTRRPELLALGRRLGGGVLVGAGIMTAGMRRAG